MADTKRTGTSSDAKGLTPPYIPFSTLKGFVEILHNTVIPTHIDKSLMRHLSGGVQSHLMVALRFLGLIGSRGEVTDLMARLHGAYGDQERWSKVLNEVVEVAYTPIVGMLDVASASDKMLDDAFRQNTSMDGTMLDRATRFYIQALAEAKVAVSPHLVNRKRRSTGKKPSAKTVKNGNGVSGDGNVPPTNPNEQRQKDVNGQPQPGTRAFPLYFKGKAVGSITVPEDLNGDDVQLIELTVGVIKAYAAQKAAT